MVYATIADVQARTTRTYSAEEQSVITALLEDAAILIDATGTRAGADAKKAVSCRMVIRAMGDGGSCGVPVGAAQGSMTAGPYTQSWTMGTGSTGELYLGKADRALLGLSNRIGSYSPTEGMVPND